MIRSSVNRADGRLANGQVYLDSRFLTDQKCVPHCTLLFLSYYRVSTPAGNAGNKPFSEFGWKSWKAIGLPPALTGKAGILFRA